MCLVVVGGRHSTLPRGVSVGGLVVCSGLDSCLWAPVRYGPVCSFLVWRTCKSAAKAFLTRDSSRVIKRPFLE